MNWTKWLPALLTGAVQPVSLQDQISALTADDLKKGQQLFTSQCALCQGIAGTGGRGPARSLAFLRTEPRAEEWLLSEWPEGASAPTKQAGKNFSVPAFLSFASFQFSFFMTVAVIPTSDKWQINNGNWKMKSPVHALRLKY